jgi:DNA modification methylase
VPGYAIGDSRALMRDMAPDSVQMVVTSPPYWGLRDNGTGPGQIGMEPTPEEYVDRMVEIFRDVRRVLRSDGVLFLNLGDSYISHVNGSQDEFRNPGLGPYGQKVERPSTRPGGFIRNMASDIRMAPNRRPVSGLKNKDLVGMPWRVALALQADGWWLRRDIIWHIPNPSPESVTDRPTRAHEYVFLLAKAERYFYDIEAVKEPVSGTANPRGRGVNRKAREGVAHMLRQNPSFSAAITGLVATRNQRSVWRVPIQPYHGQHYASYPPRLVEPCILASAAAVSSSTRSWAPVRRPWWRRAWAGTGSGSSRTRDARS